MINLALNKLISKEDLADIDIREVFDEITSGLAPVELVSAFATAFKVDNLSNEELVSAIISCSESVSYINLFNSEKMIQNIIPKSDINTDKTLLDVYLGVDLVCASCDLGCAKYAFKNFINQNKSFEILKYMGIDIEANQDEILRNFEITKFAYFYLDFEEPYFKYTHEVSQKLPFYNIFNLVDVFLNPCKIKNSIIGLINKEDIQKYADICLRLNNTNSIIINGANNLPYVSLEGESSVAEAWKNKIFTYVLTPDLLGFETKDYKDVYVENNSENAQILLDVFEGRAENSPAYITILINSALALYIAKYSSSIMDALIFAKNTINSGLVAKKISQLKNL